MASRFETNAVAEFAKDLVEFGETVIRRIGGRDDRTESILALVDFDEKQLSKVAQDSGGQSTSERGQYLEERALLDVPLAQETMPNDTYVVYGLVYRMLGEQVGKDPGAKTIVVGRRTSQIARDPRLNRR